MKAKIAIAVLLFIAAGSGIFAQEDHGKREMFRQKLDSVVREKAMKDLGLDQATTERFMTAFRSNNEKMRSIMKEKRTLMDEIEKNPNAPDIDTKLDQFVKFDSDLADQKKAYIQELKSFLSTEQVWKVLLMRRSFQKEFRKEMNKSNRHRKLIEKESQ